MKALSVFCAAARGTTTPTTAVWLAAATARPSVAGTTAGSASCWPYSSPLSQERKGNQKKMEVRWGTSRKRAFFWQQKTFQFSNAVRNFVRWQVWDRFLKWWFRISNVPLCFCLFTYVFKKLFKNLTHRHIGLTHRHIGLFSKIKRCQELRTLTGLRP